MRSAIAVGWREQQIIIVDNDQGESDASASWREGFQRLVTDIGMGHAGIVMGLEVSRLARSNSDWHLSLQRVSGLGMRSPRQLEDTILNGLLVISRYVSFEHSERKEIDLAEETCCCSKVSMWESAHHTSRRIRSRISSLVLGSPASVNAKAFAMRFEHCRRCDEYQRTYGDAG